MIKSGLRTGLVVVLMAAAVAGAAAQTRDDVPDDQGYAAQRDAIKKHVERLLDQLQKR